MVSSPPSITLILLSMAAVLAKITQDPHPPYDLTGVINPSFFKSNPTGGSGQVPFLYFDSN